MQTELRCKHWQRLISERPCCRLTVHECSQAQKNISGKAGPDGMDSASGAHASSSLHDNHAQPAQHQQALNVQTEQPMQLDQTASQADQHEQQACQADQDTTLEQPQLQQTSIAQLDHAETAQEQPETQQQTLAAAFQDVQKWLPVHGRFWCPDANCQKSYAHRADFAGYAALRNVHRHIRKEQQDKRTGHASLQSLLQQAPAKPKSSKPPRPPKSSKHTAPRVYADGRFWCMDSSCSKSQADETGFTGYSSLDSLKRHVKKELAAGTLHLGWQEMLQQKGVEEQLALAAIELPRRRRHPSNAGQQQLAVAPHIQSEAMAASEHNQIVHQRDQDVTTDNKAPSVADKNSHAATSEDVVSSQAASGPGRSMPAASINTPMEGQALEEADVIASIADTFQSDALLAKPMASKPVESQVLANPDSDISESTPEPLGSLTNKPVGGNSNLTPSQDTLEAGNSILAGDENLLAATKSSPAASRDGLCQAPNCLGIEESSLALAQRQNVMVSQFLGQPVFVVVCPEPQEHAVAQVVVLQRR